MVKILLPVDGSKHAVVATRKLVSHAAWFKEPLAVELVTVHGEMPRVTGLSRAVLAQSEIERHYHKLSLQALAKSRKLLDAAGIAHTDHVLVGEVAATLIEHARRQRCDMIYMGTRGLGALSGLVMGSVASKVLHLAPMPVVFVK